MLILLLTLKKQRQVIYLSVADVLSETVTCDDETQYCEEHEVIKPNYIYKWHRPENICLYDSQICRVFRSGSLRDAIDKHSNFFDDFSPAWLQEKTPHGYKLVVHNLKKYAFHTRDFESGKKTVIVKRISENEELDEQ